MSGCGKTIQQTTVERMYPPIELVQPIPVPEKPPVPLSYREDGKLELRQVQQWWNEYINRWKESFFRAEDDKAAIRSWMGDKE